VVSARETATGASNSSAATAPKTTAIKVRIYILYNKGAFWSFLNH
jgi:hypothetical protein